MATEVINPEGYVLATCSGTVSFLVSRKALSLASPILREMLKPQTSGGLAVKSEDSEHPMLNLPLDDPEAFRLFCEVAHHKPRSLKTPTADCLQRLVALIDRYRCSQAMADSGRLWIPDTFSGWSEEDLWKLLQFAYVLNLNKKFFDISRQLVCKISDVFWDYGN
ncbi:hypothetical protein BDW62DRAFT_203001 [Aspergillus aurantiobrunneus]